MLIEGGRIKAIFGNSETLPQADEVLDLAGKYLMPGLIDMHVHMTAEAGIDKSGMAGGIWRLCTPSPLKAMHFLHNARKAMMSGFTTLRNCGHTTYYTPEDVAVRDAIRKELVEGPNIVACAGYITMTAGHGDLSTNKNIRRLPEYNIGDRCFNGVWGCVEGVREKVRHGADFIKFMATGGVMSRGTTVGAQQMTLEEMKAICDTAKLYNMTIATHAHGTSGIKDAIRAGVTSVEHGMMMDEEGVQLMKEYGTTLVPTLIAAERIIVKGKEIGTPDWAIAKAEYVFGNATRNFKRCLDEGVKIAFGTDSGTPYNFHGKQTYEFELMVKYGMTPTQALMAATKGSSELMRKDHEIGSIEPGKFADVVAFDGDPIADVKALTSCSFVMKGGEVYKKDGVALRK